MQRSVSRASSSAREALRRVGTADPAIVGAISIRGVVRTIESAGERAHLARCLALAVDLIPIGLLGACVGASPARRRAARAEQRRDQEQGEEMSAGHFRTGASS